MKKLLFVLLAILLFSCDNPENKKSYTTTNTEKLITVSFEIGSKNTYEGVLIAYTNDDVSLWLNEKWIKAIESKMKDLSSTYSTVLLFNNKNNMPNVVTKGMNYSSDYDKYMVCGYWIYPNGTKTYCYGGVKSDGNFKKCK